jgi:hypothetical protein
LPLDALLDFTDGGSPPRPPHAQATPPSLQRPYTAWRLILSVIALPSLAAFSGGAAWVLWHVCTDALGPSDATLALSGVFLLMFAISHLAGRGRGSSMLIGWCASAALAWGVLGSAIWAIAGW